MAAPRACDWEALKRFGRYVKDNMRVVCGFDYQLLCEHVNVWTDSDHAGCPETRKSTSGGVAMLGEHCIKSWSVTQPVIALSSGEAEYYSLVKGASVALGIVGMLGDFGCKVNIVMHTDSSAAKGIGSRRGLGKVRHIELSQLWLQEKVVTGAVSIQKISGSNNISDSLTKNSNIERIKQTLKGVNQDVVRGRHPIMPHVA